MSFADTGQFVECNGEKFYVKEDNSLLISDTANFGK